MPALLTSTSTDLKRDSAVSTILAAVAGSPMCPSTRATWLEATTSVDWVTFRELAMTLKPRSTNAFTIPAPIPCDAPVTMAVFRWPLMAGYLAPAARPALLFANPQDSETMGAGDGEGAVADREADSLGGAGADVAGGQDP